MALDAKCPQLRRDIGQNAPGSDIATGGGVPTRVGPGGCTDTCEDATDGFCDDGGEGSAFSSCDYGTDCADCGERPARE